MTPADRILKHLKDNGIKQTYLAEKTGIRVQTLNNKLHNYFKFSTDEIERVCGVLGCKPNDFLKPRKGE